MPDFAGQALAYTDPAEYAKYLAIQRRENFANALMSSQMQNPTTRFSGLAQAGNQILGAFLARNADGDMAGMYAPPQQGQPQPSAPPVDPGQISNRTEGPQPGVTLPEPPPAPQGGSPLPQQTGPSPQALGAALGGGSSPPPQPPPQGAPPMQGAPQPAPASQTMGGQPPPQQGQQLGPIPAAMAAMYPAIPGMSRAQSMMMLQNSPQQYYTALTPTPEFRNALTAAGGDSQKAMQFMAGAQIKAGTTTVTRGMAIGPDGTRTYAPPPAPSGYLWTTGANGQPQLVQAQGGLAAVAGSEAMKDLGSGAVTPAPMFDANGARIPGTQNQAAGVNFSIPGITGAPLPAGARPGLGAGQETAAGQFGGAVVQRSQQYQAAANQAPLAENLLQTMQGVLNRGLKPGMSEYQNELQRMAPEYQTFMGKPLDPNNPAVLKDLYEKLASQYQMSQFGGLGGGANTDSARATLEAASPTDEKFAPALREIIPWLRANVLASKAQNNYLMQRGGNPTANPQGYQQAENSWANIYDPKVAQFEFALRTGGPQAGAGYIQHTFGKNAAAANAFKQKVQSLHPYFQQATQ